MLTTEYGNHLNPEQVLTEYPRPQMQRDSCLILNGYWDYAISREDRYPGASGRILVPFSPECALSGAERGPSPEETLWYRRTVTLPDGFVQGRVLLHFGAVDQSAEVLLGGKTAARHTGGYTPFSVDVTDYLDGGTLEITVKVRDLSDTSWHARGKQSSSPAGIWYTAQSGIWQTVWMESVPEDYIHSLKITPLYDESCLELTVFSEKEQACTFRMGGYEETFLTGTPHRIFLSSFEPWSPENPKLYDFTVTMGQDTVKSYFAMRKIHIEKGSGGYNRLFLNGKEYFQTGLLDQGYWPDGLYTAPSDQALIDDILLAKRMGFNMLRKHIKTEPLRWYYHCDRLGMLVWQDMINGGGRYNLLAVSSPLITGIHFRDRHYRLFARSEEDGRRQYIQELREMLSHLYNCPCIVLWTPFNEGWGQFDALRISRLVKELDPTRLVDHASGWHDQGGGDVQSRHVYFKRYRVRADRLHRPLVLSEFGGYSLPVAGHTYSRRSFGYKVFRDPAALGAAYGRLMEREVLPARDKGLSATVYTQLSDVENEINGMITYDRKECKLEPTLVRKWNQALRSPVRSGKESYESH